MNTFKKVLIGDTVKFTWVNSGVTMSPTFAAYDGEETLVDSGAFVDSGNGQYYYDFTVPSSGYFHLKGTGTANSKPYIRQLKVKGVAGEVD